MDTRLTFTMHIRELIAKCTKNINVIRSLTGTEWSANNESLPQIYHLFIRTAQNFGFPPYGTASATLGVGGYGTNPSTALWCFQILTGSGNTGINVGNDIRGQKTKGTVGGHPEQHAAKNVLKVSSKHVHCITHGINYCNMDLCAHCHQASVFGYLLKSKIL